MRESGCDEALETRKEFSSVCGGLQSTEEHCMEMAGGIIEWRGFEGGAKPRDSGLEDCPDAGKRGMFPSKANAEPADSDETSRRARRL